jgi:tetratricopeptide (TPR) repeat protein
LLAELTRANLLDQYSADRFQFHDLLRSYATELVAADVDPDQLLVRRRVLDWYLHTTVATERWLRPHRPPFELVEPAAPVTPTTFTDNADALRWSETERVNLVASIDCAASAGLHEHAWQLALSLSSFWYVSKRRQEWIVTSEIALRSARALGDGKAEGAILASLGAACRESRHYDEAIGHLRRALALHRATGDREREPATLNSLAVAYAESQRFEPAIAALTKAMSLHRERGNANGEALALMNIAVFHHDIGRLDQSVAYNHQALAVFRQLGDRYNAGICLANLGEVYAKLTHHERAVHCYQQAIEMHVSVGNEHGRARTLLYFGRSLCRLGQESRAHECWRTALAVFEELGEPEAEETKELLSQIGNQPAERSKPNPG